MSTHATTDGSYEIRVRGKLDDSWSAWFNGMTMAFEDDAEAGITVLTGRVDQAELRGVLSRLWDLNLTVVSVEGDGDNDN